MAFFSKQHSEISNDQLWMCTKLKLIYPSYIFFCRDALDQPELWKCTNFVQSFAWKL